MVDNVAKDDLGGGLTDMLAEVKPVLALVRSLSGNDLGADGVVADDDVLDDMVASRQLQVVLLLGGSVRL